MDAIKNPFPPGAGSPPPEMVGHAGILEQSRMRLDRIQAWRDDDGELSGF